MLKIHDLQVAYGGIQALRKALDYTMSNVSPAAVCGWLSWELRKR